MDYEDIVERYTDHKNWVEGENTTVSKEEENFMINHLKEKFRNKEIIDSFEFDLIFNWEIFPYHYGEIIEEGRHGWVVREYIIEIEDNEYYMTYFWHHDDYGMGDYEPQEPCRCFYKEVKVMKWVCEGEEE